MDAGDLRVFEAVAQLGGMNRAAQRLNTVQSNVTTRIQLLEEELGTLLFERHSRGVALTAAGKRLLPYAARVQTLIAEARRAVADNGEPKGPLVVGSLETTAGLRLPPLLTAYAATHPQVDMTLTTGTTRELVEAVREHRVEGALVCGPINHPELEERPVFHEELVVVAPAGVPDLDQFLSSSELKIIVFRLGCTYRQRLESWLTSRGIVGHRILEFATLEGILGCVAAGIGISLWPAAMVEPARRRGEISIHQLPNPERHVDTVFVRRRDAYVSSALAAFLQLLSRPIQVASEAAE
jgi:DNA-binding transcriptional LysR family regulator